MAKKKLQDLKVGDSVICTGDSGFCDTSVEKILKISTKFNEYSGKPYPIIWLSGRRRFHGRKGHATTTPLAYYIVSNTEEDE